MKWYLVRAISSEANEVLNGVPMRPTYLNEANLLKTGISLKIYFFLHPLSGAPGKKNFILFSSGLLKISSIPLKMSKAIWNS